MPKIIEIEGKYFEGTLPPGKINKKYTGIGATTSEIFTKERSSVIVFPTKAPAATKVISNLAEAEKIGIQLFYLGSPYEGFSSCDIDDVMRAAEKGAVVKICAVADSFVRHFRTKSHRYSFLKHFHLVIDEVDSFQFDAGFRESLSYCIDIYKLFDKPRRTMISATLQGFSDEILKDEPAYEFLKKHTRPIKVDAYHSAGDFEINLASLIKIALTQSKTKRLIVAYNNIEGIIRTIAALDSHTNVAVLSSEKSQTRLLSSWKKSLNNGQVDAEVVFLTSAFFSGIDLFMKADIIVAANSSHEFTRLIEAKIVQVIGRIRDYNSKKYFLYSVRKDLSSNKRLFEASLNSKIKAIDTSGRAIVQELKKDHFLQNGSEEKKVFDLLQEKLLEEDRDFVRLNLDNKLEINYLKVDSVLKQRDADTLFYSMPKATPKKLSLSGYIEAQLINTLSETVDSAPNYTRNLEHIKLDILQQQKDVFLFYLQRAFDVMYGWTDNLEGHQLINDLYNLASKLKANEKVFEIAKFELSNAKTDIYKDLYNLKNRLQYLVWAKHPEIKDELDNLQTFSKKGLVSKQRLIDAMKRVREILKPEAAADDLSFLNDKKMMQLAKMFFNLRKVSKTDRYKIISDVTLDTLSNI